jgi:RNA polymerase sigma-70 factor, ECF subfamily
VSSSTTARFPSLPISLETETIPCLVPGADVPPAECSDEFLVAKVAVGDREALALLFRRHAHRVWNIGRRILRDKAEADDLVQEVFLYIHRKGGLFDRSRGSASSWIVQVAYTQALMCRRQLKSQGLYASGIRDSSTENGSESAKGARYHNSVEWFFGRDGWKNVWGSLTEYQRETLRLRFYDGCTFAEIAEKLGQSYVNIRHHYYRALEKLREHADKNDLIWP